MARIRFWSWERSSWQVTTMPVGKCVSRTAESVVLTDCPPAPCERKTSNRMSLGSTSTSTSSISGKTATVAMLLQSEDCDKVRVVVQDPTTDAVLAQSNDIPVNLGI